MARYWYKSNRTLGFLAGSILLIFLLKTKTYEHQAYVFLPKVHPNEAWEFVADFSNMKYLNPTILDFNIIAESGNYDHWKYSAEYLEKLSHWPYFNNKAVAHFNVKHLVKENKYMIYSTHTTCFFGIYCLYSESEFKFEKSNSSEGALCEEYVKYQCPSLLSSFCKREVLFQRNAIMNNLNKKLGNKL